MKTGQRLLLIGYSLLMISVVVMFALVMCGVFGADRIAEFISAIRSNAFFTVCAVAVAVLLIVICFSMMFLCTGKAAAASTVIKSTEHGVIRVSVDSINSIALKTVKKLSYVRDCRVNTRVEEAGLTVLVRVALVNDTVIPEATTEIQQGVKSELESIVGLQVAGVPILVDNSIVPQN